MSYLHLHRDGFKRTRRDTLVVRFPFEKTLTDNPRVRWVFECIDGKDNCEKKRLLVLAAAGEIDFLSHWEATALVVGLGLECA